MAWWARLYPLCPAGISPSFEGEKDSYRALSRLIASNAISGLPYLILYISPPKPLATMANEVSAARSRLATVANGVDAALTWLAIVARGGRVIPIPK